MDDLLIFSATGQLQALVDKILTEFEGHHLQELNFVLGMEVIQDMHVSNRIITITHRKMITELLRRFNMYISDCKRSPTAQVPKEKIMSLSEDPTLERATVSEHKRFMQPAGSIQYIDVVTRPGLAFPAHVLERLMEGSPKKHSSAVQHVMRYLQSTIEVGLTFNGSGNRDVVDVFSEVDFANSVSMKCVSGMVLRMYRNCVSWRSKRQEIIAGDTTEAELIAMSRTANELTWAKQFCTDLQLSLIARIQRLWGR